MISFLILASTFILEIDKLDLEALEVFTAGAFKVYRVGDDYLICDVAENRLQLIDSQGNRRFEFTKSGPGPGELENSRVLGVWKDTIYLTKGDDRVLAFDKELKFLPREFPKLPNFVQSGVAVGENRFFIITYLNTKYNMSEILLDGSTWKVTAQAYDFRFVPEWRRPTSVVDIQDKLVFREPRSTSTHETTDTSYLIEVHDVSEGLQSNQIQVLTQEIGEEPGFEGSRHFFRYWCKVGDYYVVFVQFTTRSVPYNTVKSFVDVFALNGDFQKRVEVSTSMRTLVIMQSDEVWLLEGEEMIAQPFVIDKSKPRFGIPFTISRTSNNK